MTEWVSLQWTTHIAQIAASARRLSSWALGVFRDRSTTVMLTIWKTLIRYKLEYNCPLWHPHKQQDVKTLEDVQRYFTRHILGMKDTDYWERLKNSSWNRYRGEGSDTSSAISGRYSTSWYLMMWVWSSTTEKDWVGVRKYLIFQMVPNHRQ